MARRSQRLRRQKRIEKRKAREEAKLSKTIEDNSVILERMKNMSKCLDEVCETFDTEETKPEQIVTPVPSVEMKAEPSVEMKIQPYNEPSLIAPETPDFKNMLKREVLTYAKENNGTVKASMTKAQIIKAIQEA